MMLYPHYDSNGCGACLVCFMPIAAVSTEDVPTEKRRSTTIRCYGRRTCRACSLCRDGRLAPLTEECVQLPILATGCGPVEEQ